MPGLLSSVFDDGTADGQSAEAQSYDATAEAGQDADLGIDTGVGVEMGGSYQNPDGSTSTWSNSQDVNLDADLDATVGAVLSAGADQAGYDAG